MNVLQLHERTAIKGGVEVYIDQLQALLPSQGINSYWIGIDDYGQNYRITEYRHQKVFETNSLKEVFEFIASFVNIHDIQLINIHNLFNKEIVSFCLELRPVIKSAHGPVMVCPGKDKFWRHSETPCSIKYGMHCFRHIYTQGCSNRHPTRVIKAWNIVNYEIRHASLLYKKIVVMSEYIRSGLLECGIPQNKIACNPYFTPEVDGQSDISHDLSLKNLLFVGRLISSKGPHLLIRSLSDLLNTRSDLHLHIVGDGPLKDELVHLATELGLKEKITFHGWLSRDMIDNSISQCYILLFPSIYPEAFGIVGIEGMMRGKPVVAFDVGGVSTWLKNGVSGFAVNNKDEVAMREKTEMLLNNESLYREMSSAAKDIALREFSPAVHIAKLIETYRVSLQ